MRIAVVFDDLIQFGGAERLLLAVHELYPDAPIYTSLASQEWLERCKKLNITLTTSFMQKLPFKKSLNRFYGLIGLHALAFESFRFDNYDTVLSVSARFAHGIVTKPGTVHICYMNSPGRMFWEPWDYFERENFMQDGVVRAMFWALASPFLALLRLWDYSSSQRVDHFIANSKVPQDRIKKYYKRDSEIIYPFVESLQSDSGARHEYFLVIARLNAWKRVDIAIDACKKLGVGLKIIGDGPDRERLKVLSAGGNVEFLGYVSEEEKSRVIAGCSALIMTQKEDFGITALEAMSLGKPVIAFEAGGALETVLEGVTGEFFDEQNSESLVEVLSAFDGSVYKEDDCKRQAGKFSKQKFMQELDAFVKNVYHRKINCV